MAQQSARRNDAWIVKRLREDARDRLRQLRISEISAAIVAAAASLGTSEAATQCRVGTSAGSRYCSGTAEISGAIRMNGKAMRAAIPARRSRVVKTPAAIAIGID